MTLTSYQADGQSTTKSADQQATRLNTFVERIDVRVVNVEAVVVDGDGNRVIGLSPDDFALRVDGADVRIGFFSEIRNGHGIAPDSNRQPDTSDSLVSPPKPEIDYGRLPPNAPIRTSYLLFIDNYFTTSVAQRNRLIDGIELDLSLMGTDDHMAIVAFDGRRPEMLSSWSNSSEHLRRALADARALPASGFVTSSPGRANRDGGTNGPAGGFAAGLQGGTDNLVVDNRASTFNLERQIERIVLGVTSTLRTFAKPPGRKVMILLSGGWPHSIRDYVAGGPADGATAGSLLSAGDMSLRGREIYRPIYDTANLLGYTLYPVDVPAQPGPAISAAESGGRLSGSGASSLAELQFNSDFELKSTLHTLATQTGGRALIGGDAKNALAEVSDDTSSYYWLGFTPSWHGDDSNHKIKLTVRQTGLKVRTRKGFQDLSPQSEVTFVTESALMFGSLPGAHPLGLTFGRHRSARGGKVEIPIEVSIPMDAVAMLPWKGRYLAELELRIAVLDESGNRNEIPTISVPIEGTEPPPPGAYSIYETSIRIRRQNHAVVVSLYDPVGDTILASSGQVKF